MIDIENKSSYRRSIVEDDHQLSDDIAAYSGGTRDTIYDWIMRRNIPAHKVGRLWKFKKDEVDKWVISGGADEAKNKGEK